MAHKDKRLSQLEHERKRECALCALPVGKWTCCAKAFCNHCVLLHWA